MNRSFVFEPQMTAQAAAEATQKVEVAPWWIAVNGELQPGERGEGRGWTRSESVHSQPTGATWRQPHGPGSDALTDELRHHPVVHVSWNDAVAYCAWAYPAGGGGVGAGRPPFDAGRELT